LYRCRSRPASSRKFKPEPLRTFSVTLTIKISSVKGIDIDTLAGTTPRELEAIWYL